VVMTFIYFIPLHLVCDNFPLLLLFTVLSTNSLNMLHCIKITDADGNCLSINAVESRLSKLASLSTHLTEAVEKKSLITSRLQKPYTGENLIIDASLHKYVVVIYAYYITCIYSVCLVVVYMCVTVCSDTCCSM